MTGVKNGDFSDYVGRTRLSKDSMDAEKAQLLQSCLDQTPSLAAGDCLPPLVHWLYFQTPVKQADLQDDGHEKPGAFLPPVPFPRRMWAASSVKFIAPFLLGEPAEKRSTVRKIDFKTGASGDLCFVDVHHDYVQRDELTRTEIQTIVYKDESASELPKAANVVGPTRPANTPECSVGTRLLFRYSALTFNTHRIHYDRDYAQNAEGYPGLVVHGPLLATLLCEAALKKASSSGLISFSFRASAPIFDGERFTIESETGHECVRLKAKKSDGITAMTAKMEWAQ